jgi:SHS2 domain-containing protein
MKAQVIARPVKSMEKQIKAVTYHGLQIEQTENGIRATVVFDV